MLLQCCRYNQAYIANPSYVHFARDRAVEHNMQECFWSARHTCKQGKSGLDNKHRQRMRAVAEIDARLLQATTRA